MKTFLKLSLASVPLAAVLVVSRPSALRAQAAAPAPATLPAGTDLLPPGDLSPFVTGLDAHGPVQIMPAQAVPRGQSWTQALRLRTDKKPINTWDFQIGTPLAVPIAKDDVLLASFWMRTIRAQAGSGRTNLILEDATSYNKSVFYSATAAPTGAWKQFFVPFSALQDEAVGQAHLNFHLGFVPQTIEIADVRLQDFGPHQDIKTLPRTAVSYEGREPDAPWRRAARERIEKIRKGPLQVLVVDSRGKPIRGASVQVKMTRHAFPFGAAVDNQFFYGTTPEVEKYREMFFKLFNRVTLSRALKWGEWEGNSYDPFGHRYTRAEALSFVKMMRAHGTEVRGHNLVWPAWLYEPQLEPLKNDPPAMSKVITDHISDEVGALKGQCVEWDVVNEPYDHHVLMDILGPGAMATWYKTAHAADPNARLFVNDNGILENNGEDIDHAEGYEKTIRDLLSAGAPIGGIGMEGHYTDILTPPVKLLSMLDKFAKLGLPIETTEFDVDSTDEQLQADYLRDYMIATFSHPAVNGFVQWGFWAGDNGMPQAALFRHDWSIRPNGKAYLDLVFNKWWTQAQGSTNRAGKYLTRGFLGDYEITASKGARVRTVKASLAKAGTALIIALP